MRKRRGFTLIELLVVIAIIALLMAILMPSLQRVKKMAQATVCRSNVKQWGLIFRLYANDNEGKLPQSVAGGNLNDQEAYWIVATLSYYQDKKIRLCPSTKIVREMANRSHGGTLAAWGPFDSGGSSDWWADFDTGSYGINEWCSCPPPGANSYWGFPTENAWRTVDTKGGNRIPLFMDCVYVDVYPLETNAPLDFEPPPYRWSNSWGDWGVQAMRLVCIDRHSGGINSVFLDGSVGKISLRALWTLKWHRNFNTSGPWTKAGGAGVDDWPQWMRRFKDD
ncbi:MAG: type II secretion system protein [Planctomycetes bacterium]|nr:type II secretion system protein [Planctomycetota bacterium]MCH8119389.1 type II secretion system protein [Planctomycetota bacterium]